MISTSKVGHGLDEGNSASSSPLPPLLRRRRRRHGVARGRWRSRRGSGIASIAVSAGQLSAADDGKKEMDAGHWILRVPPFDVPVLAFAPSLSLHALTCYYILFCLLILSPMPDHGLEGFGSGLRASRAVHTTNLFPPRPRASCFFLPLVP